MINIMICTVPCIVPEITKKGGGYRQMSREWTKTHRSWKSFLQNFADIIWEYDTRAKDLYPETECAQRFGLPPVIHNGAGACSVGYPCIPDYLPSLSHVFRSLESRNAHCRRSFSPGLAPVRITSGTGRFYLLFGRCREYAGSGFFQDIDSEVQHRLKLQHQQIWTATGVYNAAAGGQLHTEPADAARAPCTHNAMFVFDVDNFKSINDTYGHCQGDEGTVPFCIHSAECMPPLQILFSALEGTNSGCSHTRPVTKGLWNVSAKVLLRTRGTERKLCSRQRKHRRRNQ